MSPPCQPFTRNGLKCDIADNRSNSFLHLLNILHELSIENILIENVKGFEQSIMRNKLVEKLNQAGFVYQEFILSPSQFGIPNSRHRYYCLVKKSPKTFKFDTTTIVSQSQLDMSIVAIVCLFQLDYLPGNYSNVPFEISSILEKDIDHKEYALPQNILQKRAKLVDVCYSNSTRSCCFTKAYGRYLEGTGSVYSTKPEEFVQAVLKELSSLDIVDSEEYLKCVQQLDFRFFTPREVCRLMSFPEYFDFPEGITRRQKYMLLGNSVNVKVVAELIKILAN